MYGAPMILIAAEAAPTASGYRDIAAGADQLINALGVLQVKPLHGLKTDLLSKVSQVGI